MPRWEERPELPEGEWVDGHYYPSQEEEDAMQQELADAGLFPEVPPTDDEIDAMFEAELSDAMGNALKEQARNDMAEAPPYYSDDDIPF